MGRMVDNLCHISFTIVDEGKLRVIELEEKTRL